MRLATEARSICKFIILESTYLYRDFNLVPDVGFLIKKAFSLEIRLVFFFVYEHSQKNIIYETSFLH